MLKLRLIFLISMDAFHIESRVSIGLDHLLQSTPIVLHLPVILLVEKGQVLYIMFFEVVAMKANELTNKVSIQSSITFSADINSWGISIMSLTTDVGVDLLVLPFRDGISGPKILSASSMSSKVTGQSLIEFILIMFFKCLMLGQPSACSNTRARWAINLSIGIEDFIIFNCLHHSYFFQHGFVIV